MKKITLKKLINLLSLDNKSKIISFTAITRPRVIKDGPTDLIKISRVNGVINFSYANAVNKQRSREGKRPNFIPFRRRWGERLLGTPFVVYNDNYYLEVKVEKILSTEYKISGVVVDYDDVAEFIYQPQSVANHQGVNKEIIIRDYSLTNIDSITIDGKEYSIA